MIAATPGGEDAAGTASIRAAILRCVSIETPATSVAFGGKANKGFTAATFDNGVDGKTTPPKRSDADGLGRLRRQRQGNHGAACSPLKTASEQRSLAAKQSRRVSPARLLLPL